MEEKKILAGFAVKIVNKGVLTGNGGTVIREVVELTGLSEDIGADGVVVISPYYSKRDSGLCAIAKRLCLRKTIKKG